MAAIVIRESTRTDYRYLSDTIRTTLLLNSAFCKGLHPATLEAMIDPILGTYTTLVAVVPGDEDQILGFLTYRDPNTAAFLYVRSDFRSRRNATPGGPRLGGGIARALLARAGIARATPGKGEVPEIACAFMVTKLDGSHGQGAFASIAESKGYRLRFRPYAPLEATARVMYGRGE
jgi:hypothetical protein